MSPKHGPWRARAVLGLVAKKQIKALSVPEIIAADRAVVAIQTQPRIADLLVDNPPYREYREPGTGVRVIYHLTTSGAVFIDYIEV